VRGSRRAVVSGLNHVLLGQICVQTTVTVMSILKTITYPDSNNKQGHMGEEELTDEPLRFGSEANTETERPCREGFTRHEGPTNVRTAPLPKLMTTVPLNPAQGISINRSCNRSQLPSEVSNRGRLRQRPRGGNRREVPTTLRQLALPN